MVHRKNGKLMFEFRSAALILSCRQEAPRTRNFSFRFCLLCLDVVYHRLGCLLSYSPSVLRDIGRRGRADAYNGA
jgi:hypothetical protein